MVEPLFTNAELERIATATVGLTEDRAFMAVLIAGRVREMVSS